MFIKVKEDGKQYYLNTDSIICFHDSEKKDCTFVLCRDNKTIAFGISAKKFHRKIIRAKLKKYAYFTVLFLIFILPAFGVC